jgi:hypothetical protein
VTVAVGDGVLGIVAFEVRVVVLVANDLEGELFDRVKVESALSAVVLCAKTKAVVCGSIGAVSDTLLEVMYKITPIAPPTSSKTRKARATSKTRLETSDLFLNEPLLDRNFIEAKD